MKRLAILSTLAVAAFVVATQVFTMDYLGDPLWQFLTGISLGLATPVGIRVALSGRKHSKTDLWRIEVIAWINLLVFGIPLLLMTLTLVDAEGIATAVTGWYDGLSTLVLIPVSVILMILITVGAIALGGAFIFAGMAYIMALIAPSEGSPFE